MHVDMPVADLKTYMGKSPFPPDFNAYWKRGLNELDNQSLDYELEQAEFQTDFADCYHLYFSGVGGARIHCKFIKPKKSTGQGMVIFHGYSVDSGDWLDKVAYAAQGITVLAMDCRGQGGLSEDNLVVTGNTLKGHIIRGLGDSNPDNFYYRQVFLDAVQTVRMLTAIEGVDTDRIGVCGQSQGGALAIACAALEPNVKEVFAVYPYLSDYKRVWEMDIENSAYEELAYYFRCYDPNHFYEDEIFTKLGYIDIQNLADRIQGNVLWATGLRDMICPPSTQFAAYNKIKANKELLLYHEYGHEFLPNHADLVFQRFASKL